MVVREERFIARCFVEAATLDAAVAKVQSGAVDESWEPYDEHEGFGEPVGDVEFIDLGVLP